MKNKENDSKRYYEMKKDQAELEKFKIKMQHKSELAKQKHEAKMHDKEIEKLQLQLQLTTITSM